MFAQGFQLQCTASIFFQGVQGRNQKIDSQYINYKNSAIFTDDVRTTQYVQLHVSTRDLIIRDQMTSFHSNFILAFTRLEMTWLTHLFPAVSPNRSLENFVRRWPRSTFLDWWEGAGCQYCLLCWWLMVEAQQIPLLHCRGDQQSLLVHQNKQLLPSGKTSSAITLQPTHHFIAAAVRTSQVIAS